MVLISPKTLWLLKEGTLRSRSKLLIKGETELKAKITPVIMSILASVLLTEGKLYMNGKSYNYHLTLKFRFLLSCLASWATISLSDSELKNQKFISI